MAFGSSSAQANDALNAVWPALVFGALGSSLLNPKAER
jgi:hypothetical protein